MGKQAREVVEKAGIYSIPRRVANEELVARWVIVGLSLFVVATVALVLLALEAPAREEARASVLPCDQCTP